MGALATICTATDMERYVTSCDLIPPDPGDTYLSIVAREADAVNDHVNWFFMVNWRDG